MKTAISISLLIGQVIMLTGCTIITVESFTLNDAAARAASDPEQIAVYTNEKDVPAAFERLAYLAITGPWKSTSDAKFIQKAKDEAAKLGANAVLLKEDQDGVAAGFPRPRVGKGQTRFGIVVLRSSSGEKEPNKAPEPTPGAVTPRARGSACDFERRDGARVAPAPVVAHL